MQFKWNYEPLTPDRQQAAKELAEKIGMSPVMASLLIQRGIKTESAAKRFFRPMLNELIDPFLMNDMDVAVDRLNDAMGRKERIMVYGDYDVDGCTAVALVYKFLQQFYSNRGRGLWCQQEGNRLCRRDRGKTDYRTRLRHQGGRGDSVCQGAGHRLHHLRPPRAR